MVAEKISASGLQAATRALEAAAANIANVRSTRALSETRVEPVSEARRAGGQADRPPAEPYRPLETVNESLAGGGVRARLREVQPASVPVYEPDDPNADESGVVARPNVDLGHEVLKLRAAQRAYEANLAPIRTQDRMIGSLLDSFS